MFLLAALSVQTVWEGLESSTVRPMFYFLMVSHFTTGCQDLWGQWECMEISVRRCYVQALSHSSIQLFPSQINKNDKKANIVFPLSHLSLFLSVTQQLAHTVCQWVWVGWAWSVSFSLRWGDIPAQAQSGAEREGVKWCPEPAHRSLSFWLTAL